MTGDQYIGAVLLTTVAVSEARARLHKIATAPSVAVHGPCQSAAAGLDGKSSAAALSPSDTA